MKGSSCRRRNSRYSSVLPRPSTPCIKKTFFARSIPNIVTFISDPSSLFIVMVPIILADSEVVLTSEDWVRTIRPATSTDDNAQTRRLAGQRHMMWFEPVRASSASVRIKLPTSGLFAFQGSQISTMFSEIILDEFAQECIAFNLYGC